MLFLDVVYLVVLWFVFPHPPLPSSALRSGRDLLLGVSFLPSLPDLGIRTYRAQSDYYLVGARAPASAVRLGAELVVGRTEVMVPPNSN